MTLTDRLTDCALFAGLPAEVVEPVESIAQVAAAAAGEVIFAENELAGDLYILETGRVTLSFSFPTPAGISQVNICRVEPGDVFGWSTLTASGRFSASATALSESSYLRLAGGALRDLMDRDPRLGYAVMDRLASLAGRRLRDSREQIRMLLTW